MNNLTNEQRAIADAAFAQRLNVVHHAYVDIAGDLIAGMLLGQILYWHGTGKDGASRAKIQKDGRLWIAKARGDWHSEIRISPKQYDRAIKILRDKGFVEVKTMKFAGNPTTHLSINGSTITEALDEWKVSTVRTMFTEGEQRAAAGVSPSVNLDIDLRGTTGLPDGTEGASPLGNIVVPDKAITSYTEITYRENERENSQTQEAGERVHRSDDIERHAITQDYIRESFIRAWEEYPRKEGRAKAFTAFERSIRGIGQRRDDGEPWTPDEIVAEVILYRQHVERRVEMGELEARFIPSGGTWFEREGWTDEIPSISSTFDDMLDGMDFNRNAAELRRIARSMRSSAERTGLLARMLQVRAALPY